METENIIAVIVAGLILIQLIIMYFSFKGENERKKKQSTVEYINTIRAIYKPIYNELNEKFNGNERVINLNEIDDKLKTEIKELLSTIEHLSVGLNTGIYDFYIFFRMSGSYFLRIFKKLQPYISNAQKNMPSAYIEFEAICKKIEIEKEKRNMKMTISRDGNIKYS
jgi:hypothetical protein